MTCLPGYQQSFFSCLQALLYFFWISLKPERELKYGGYNTKIILNFITIMRLGNNLNSEINLRFCLREESSPEEPFLVHM